MEQKDLRKWPLQKKNLAHEALRMKRARGVPGATKEIFAQKFPLFANILSPFTAILQQLRIIRNC